MRRSKDGPPTVTPRQREVLELVASGQSNREIASRLQISENGVKAHIARLLVKFGVANRAALVGSALPGRGETDGSAPDLYLLLDQTLSEVIGRTATEALLRRALRLAASRDPQLEALMPENSQGSPPVQWWSARGRGLERVRAVLRELWPLLVENTGQVLVARLERRGLAPGDEPRGAVRT